MIRIHEHGFVGLVSWEGTEKHISEIAGISHDSDKGPSVKKLLEWGHLSPLEFADMTFHIKCPIFVARQLFRHRTGKYMERSLRYCESNAEFYIPQKGEIELLYDAAYRESYKAYLELIKMGADKEQARGVLPLATYTEYYFKIDLRNLVNLLKLRLHKDAQAETREYAEAMAQFVKIQFPSVYNYVVSS